MRSKLYYSISYKGTYALIRFPAIRIGVLMSKKIQRKQLFPRQIVVVYKWNFQKQRLKAQVQPKPQVWHYSANQGGPRKFLFSFLGRWVRFFPVIDQLSARK